MIDIARFRKKAEGYGLELPQQLLENLDTYAALLLDWSTRMNLTAIKDAEGIEDKHFIDSLLLAMQPEVKGSLVDVGSGAGFPGMVVQLYKPEVAVTLMEPTGKRCSFLTAVAGELGIQPQVVKERAEEAARKSYRESFAVATARAVAALPVLAEYCLPLVQVGGTFLAMKGDVDEELAGAGTALQRLGGTLREVREYTLPDDSHRSIVVVDKVETTPKTYPRNGGTIAKKPL